MTVVEDFGEPSQNLHRLVSLCPSITESLFALGLGDRVVGRTRFCVHPEQAARVPVVGGTKDPEIERILALGADLILANREENRREDVEKLATSTPVEVSFPRDPEGVASLLRHWGQRFDRRSRAEAAATEIEQRLNDVTSRRAPFRFLYLIWQRPWMAAARGTYVDSLLARAGGVNVVDGPVDYPEVNLEALVASGLDVILLSSEPFPFEARHRQQLERQLGCAVRLVDGEDLGWHGTRTVCGIAAASAIGQSLQRA